VDVRAVPGNHISVLAEPHVQTLAARLAETLDAADTSEGKPFDVSARTPDYAALESQ
jgi:hypothetical protein